MKHRTTHVDHFISVLESDISSPVLGPAEIPFIPEQVYPLWKKIETKNPIILQILNSTVIEIVGSNWLHLNSAGS